MSLCQEFQAMGPGRVDTPERPCTCYQQLIPLCMATLDLILEEA